MRFGRPFITPDGKREYVRIKACGCTPKKQRGPAGGVCSCGGAILRPDEAKVAQWEKEGP